MGPCYVVVRRARDDAGERAARAGLVRDWFAALRGDAFWLFLFQEVTLQAAVLCGAVLFIFFGATLLSLSLLLPAAAALLWAMVYVAHASLADKQIQEQRRELSGWVAELRAPLVTSPGAAETRALVQRAQLVAEGDPLVREIPNHLHSQLLMTMSVSELCGARGYWLHSLAFRQHWIQSAAARALLSQIRRWGVLEEAGGTVECVTCQLPASEQVAELLYSASFTPRGSYHRRLLGGCVTLSISHHSLSLHHQ